MSHWNAPGGGNADSEVNRIRRQLFICDPNKNTECKKTSCFTIGGPCSHTTERRFAADENKVD